MLFRMVVFACFFAIATPVVALDPGPIAQDLIIDWRNWMKKHRISEGSVLVAFEGKIVAVDGIGRSTDDVAKVASLSKSITAVCALTAMSNAGKKHRTPLSDAIPKALSEYPPSDKRFSEITIGQLITHTSGITSRYHSRALKKLRSFGKENKLWQFSKLVKEGLAAAPGKAAYHYSNANYLTLGLVIEELSGEDYESYCQRKVLAPAGVTTGQLNKTWTVMSSWGGWEISPRDFFRFASLNFAGDNSPNRPGGHYLPSASVGKGRHYGAGVLFRKTNLGHNVWHIGSWNWNGRIKDRFGAYFALYDNGFSVVTNYAHDAWKKKIRNELESILWRATHR